MTGEVVILGYEHVSPENLVSLRRAAAAREIRLTEWEPHRLSIDTRQRSVRYEGRPAHPAAVMHRTVARLHSFVSQVLAIWDEGGTRVLNDPAAAALSRDKLATSLALSRRGVPCVPSIGFFPWEGLDLGQALPDADAEVVVKPAHGKRGAGVERYSGPGPASAAYRRVEWGADDVLASEYYVAQPLVGSPGTDLRAYVVGGRCVALGQRFSTAPGEFRANVHLGATVEALPVDSPAGRVAVDAMDAIGLEVGGVDMVEADAGPAVIEVDAWAGFAALEAATGADVAGAVLERLMGRR